MSVHPHATDWQRVWRGVLPTERPADWPVEVARGWALLSAHVHQGMSIRELADQERVQPSTIRAWLRIAERCAFERRTGWA